MGEIRIIGPGKKRGYPYPVCKKNVYVEDFLKCLLFKLAQGKHNQAGQLYNTLQNMSFKTESPVLFLVSFL